MTSSCERAQLLAAARIVVLKIGSAVITGPAGLDIQVIQDLADQLSAIRNRTGKQIIVVSSGAVAAGRAILEQRQIPFGRPTQTARQACAAIGQGCLMQAWTRAFAENDLISAQILLTRDDLRARDRFQHASNTFTELLAWGVVPIINENDTVAVHELQFGDNDCLASLLVNLVQADIFVNLTSAPGVLAADPEKNPDAKVINCIPDIDALNIDEICGAKTTVGSGGMYSKLLAARRVAQLGVSTLILPGRQPNVLRQAFEAGQGENSPGTWIAGKRDPIPRRKFWLAYQSSPKGAVHLDEGAATALTRQGRSLLPGGIQQMEGAFDKGDLVSVIHNGKLLGVGFSNYNSADLQKIIGRKRHEIAAILGNARYPDVIHRDNLLLDAAL